MRINFEFHFSKRLAMRGYENLAFDNGLDAVKAIRSDPDIDVVILDRKMPVISGKQTLKEIKQFRPEIQVIMLTAFGDTASAMEAGKLDAFSYLQKPCELDTLIETIDSARQEKIYAMSRYEIPHDAKGSMMKWLIGSHNSRPGLIILAFLFFIGILICPCRSWLICCLRQKQAS